MKELIIIGGAPYTGKSTFCKKLEAESAGKYNHIDFDRLFNELSTDGTKFLKYLRALSPEIADDVQIGGVQEGINDPTGQLRHFARYMIATSGLNKFEQFMQHITGAYLAERLITCQNLPILEGLFTSIDRRVGSYKAIKDFIPKLTPSGTAPLDLDTVKKTLVFFNLGLGTSLKRWQAGRAQDYASVTTSEAFIRNVYREQQLPSTSELPNLDIILINNPQEIESIIKKLLS